MFAVIETGGKQYKVEKGSSIDIELLEGKKDGDSVSFCNVLMLSDKDDLKVGMPYLKGTTVEGKVISHGRAAKTTAFKFKRKTNYHRTIGHKHPFVTVQIESINPEVKSA
jgi:large subunit ribosomal protein L21